MVKNTNAKANRFGREVDPWIQALWPRAQRKGRGIPGCDYTDTGDVAIELKNHARMDLGTWMTQVETDAAQENRLYPTVIHKRRRFATERAYVTMPLEAWVKMLASLMGVELPEGLEPVSDPSEVPDWPDSNE